LDDAKSFSGALAGKPRRARLIGYSRRAGGFGIRGRCEAALVAPTATAVAAGTPGADRPGRMECSSTKAVRANWREITSSNVQSEVISVSISQRRPWPIAVDQVNDAQVGFVPDAFRAESANASGRPGCGTTRPGRCS